jgi:secreted trypsin-like serine protease
MRRIFLAGLVAGGFAAALWPARALAIVGGAAPADPSIARHIVLIVGSRGNSCTGVAIASNLVLTVAHCVLPGAEYRLVEFDAAGQPQLRDVSTVMRHPQFSLETILNHRATPDIAVLRLAEPLPAAMAPVALSLRTNAVVLGDQLLVAGYGLAVPGDGRSGGKIRSAMLSVTGQPGTLQIRLHDPITRNARAGLGACTGDSGAPVFDVRAGAPAVIGLVSWSTGPNNASGCGGLTGVTPLIRYRAWIAEAAAILGSPL